MYRSLFRQFSIAAVVITLIVSGASVASADDEDLSFSVTASPTEAYAVAGEGSWVVQVAVHEEDQPADLTDPADLAVTSASSAVTLSTFTHSELGLYTAHVTSDVPDTYVLSVTYGGLQINSPVVQFFSSGPDPSHSTLFAVPEQVSVPCGSAVVEDPVIATATVRDDQGTGIPGLEVVFEYGGDTPATKTTDNDGVASAELFFDAPDVPTTKIVTATVNANGESIDLPSASVEIEPTGACSSEALGLNWTLEYPSQVVGLSLRVLITALDVNGQITTMDPTKLTVQTSSDGVRVDSPSRRFDGSYAVALNSSTPGDYTVTVTYDGRTYGLSLPFSFVAPAPLPEILPDMDQSYIVVSKWLADPGDQVVVTAVMRDFNGQGVDNAQVFFSMTGSDAYHQTTCTTLADGRCSITVSAAIPATYDILARFNGQLFGSGQTVQFLGEDERDYQISMDVSAVSGGPMRADGYDSWEAWITILEADGTPVTDALPGVGLTVFDASNAAMVMSLDNSTIERQPGGVYHTYLTSRVAGSYLVYAYFGWTWADPVTVSFIAVPPNEPGTRLILTPLPNEPYNAVQVSTDDREVQAQAVIHDEQGLPLNMVKVDFVTGSDGDVLSARQCYTDTTGTCAIRVWPNGLGDHSINASIDSVPLIGSPAIMHLVSPWYAGTYDQLYRLDEFTVSAPTGGSVPADGASQWVGTVTLGTDYDGFDLSGLTEDVEGMLTPSNPAVTVGDVIDNGDDTYTVTFTSHQPGDFMVTAYYLGVAIERDLTFVQVPPSADPQQSSLAAASLLADVGTQVVLTAMVKDSTGVLMGSVDVSFTAEAPGVLSQQGCTTEPDGRCTVSVTSNEAATIHVSAFVNDQQISGSMLSIQFQSSSPTASASPSVSPSSSPSSSTSASPSSSTTSPSPTSSTTSPSPSSSTTSASPSSSTSPTATPTSASSSPTESSTSASPTQSTSVSQSPTSASSTPTSASSTPTGVPTSAGATSTSTTPTQSTSVSSPASPSTSQSPTSRPTNSQSPTGAPTSASPTQSSTSANPTQSSMSANPTQSSASPSQSSTASPSQSSTSATPSQSSTSASPTGSPTNTLTQSPTQSTPAHNPTLSPTSPTQGPTGSPTSSPSTPTAPPSTPTTPASPEIDLNLDVVTLGQTLTIGGEHWYPGETVRITLYSTQRVLGTETVNPDGTLPTLAIIIPADLETGQHTIKVEGSVSGTYTTSFTVLAAPTSAPAAPLVATGGTAAQSPARWALIGFIAIGAGVILNRTWYHFSRFERTRG